MEEIILGSVVRDKITNLEGKVTARAIHLHGCDRYWVQPPIDKDGKPREGTWIDVQALEVIETPAVAPTKRANGGFNSAVK